jgi:hypothetical protein
MQAVLATREIGHDRSPEQSRRLVRLDVENLPLTGETAQEGGNDKPRDTLATKAPGHEQVTDVVFGTAVGFVIHGHEPGQFPSTLMRNGRVAGFRQ